MRSTPTTNATGRFRNASRTCRSSSHAQTVSPSVTSAQGVSPAPPSTRYPTARWMRSRLRPASSSDATMRSATRSWTRYRWVGPGGGVTSPLRAHEESCGRVHPVRRAACAAVNPTATAGSGLVVAAPALTPPAPGVAEHVLQRPGPGRAGEVLESGFSELADVALDHEQAPEHDQEPDHPEEEHAGEGEEEERQAGDEAGHGPLDRPGRVPVQGRLGDLLDQPGIGLVEVGLDLLEDPLLVFREGHASRLLRHHVSTRCAPSNGVRIIVAQGPTPLNAPTFPSPGPTLARNGLPAAGGRLVGPVDEPVSGDRDVDVGMAV